MVVTNANRACSSFKCSFQSPFHRGNGCNSKRGYQSVPLSSTFSPLFIGAMVVTARCGNACGGQKFFQSPFHRGNGCNLIKKVRAGRKYYTFSPLFIGAMVVTVDGVTSTRTNAVFQSPFHRGNGCNTRPTGPDTRRLSFFQSPFHRGNGCNRNEHLSQSVDRLSFSPLFIGAMVVTSRFLAKGIDYLRFQSPFHRGNGCNTRKRSCRY